MRYGTHGAVDGNLPGVFVHLLNHECGGAVAGECGSVGKAFGECRSGYSRWVPARGIITHRLRCEVLRREYSLPFQCSPELLPE